MLSKSLWPNSFFQFVLPLLTVLVERHFEIFRACQKHTIHEDELWDAADTVDWVFKAVNARFEVLQCGCFRWSVCTIER
jgi:hypothetical protein